MLDESVISSMSRVSVKSAAEAEPNILAADWPDVKKNLVLEVLIRIFRSV